MTYTTPPRKLGSAATSPPRELRCPRCGGVVQWVIGQVNGAYAYQPCGHYGGKLAK